MEHMTRSYSLLGNMLKSYCLRFFTFQSIVGLMLMTGLASKASAQCSIVSSEGYTVQVSARPTRVIAPEGCINGYSYWVEVAYTVTFSGRNIPASLWTLQGSVGCTGGGLYFDLPNEGGSGTIITANSYRNVNDCNTVTPAALGCSFVNIEIGGPGIPQQTVSCAIRPLPVSLTSFKAFAQAQGVAVSWATAMELNNASFAVERSPDARTWAAVHQRAGAGTTSQATSYSWLDKAPLKGKTFYRLKQTDFDGTTTYSSVVSVAGGASVAEIRVAPNPSQSRHIQVLGLDEPAKWALQVVSATGQPVFRQLLASSEVALPRLAAGIYFLHVQHQLTGQRKVLKYSQE